MQTTLASLYAEKDQVQASIKTEKERHEKTAGEHAVKLHHINTALNQHGKGLDVDKIKTGWAVIFISGSYAKAGGDSESAVSDAIRFLATGDESNYRSLWDNFYGVKDYARWHGQRSDHQYGYGPSHGHTTFAIGFHADIRKRESKELTPEETEAAIYVLHNLLAIQDAEVAA